MRAAGDYRGGSALDESPSLGAGKARRLPSEVRPIRSEGQTLPRNNRKTTKHKSPPGLDPRQGQLLKNRGESNHAAHNKRHAGYRLQPSHFSPRGDLPTGKLNAMIHLAFSKPFPYAHL